MSIDISSFLAILFMHHSIISFPKSSVKEIFDSMKLYTIALLAPLASAACSANQISLTFMVSNFYPYQYETEESCPVAGSCGKSRSPTLTSAELASKFEGPDGVGSQVI